MNEKKIICKNEMEEIILSQFSIFIKRQNILTLISTLLKLPEKYFSKTFFFYIYWKSVN